MAEKDGKNKQKEGAGTRILGTLAAMAAAFLARKLMTMAWTRVTGSEPPSHPEDPQVGLGEALAWAILTGVSVEAARLIATRAMTRKFGHGREDNPEAVVTD
jgi:Protein of unknown function (DUF4235)